MSAHIAIQKGKAKPPLPPVFCDVCGDEKIRYGAARKPYCKRCVTAHQREVEAIKRRQLAGRSEREKIIDVAIDVAQTPAMLKAGRFIVGATGIKYSPYAGLLDHDPDTGRTHVCSYEKAMAVAWRVLEKWHMTFFDEDKFGNEIFDLVLPDDEV